MTFVKREQKDCNTVIHLDISGLPKSASLRKVRSEMTYIGDIKELKRILNDLSGYPGFGRLEAEVKSNDWEQFESAFAVAIEAHRFHVKKMPIQLCPEVTTNGEVKTPDFKVKLIYRWIYFEVKTSSMFPFEKKFLRIKDKIHKGLESITSDLKFVIKIHQEKISEKHVAPLVRFIQRRASTASRAAFANFPQRYFYPDTSNSIVECVFLGSIEPAVYAGNMKSRLPFNHGEEFIQVRATNLKEPRKSKYAVLRTPRGKKLMFIGGEEFDVHEYFRELAKQLPEFQGSLNERYFELFLVNLFDVLSVENYLMIGVSPPYKPEDRVKKIMNDALKQLSPDDPNLVIIYSREVILQMKEVEKSLDNIFAFEKYNKISSVIADIQSAIGKRERRLFVNRRGIMPLTEDEIDCLGSEP